MATVGIIGSRDYPDEAAVRAYVRALVGTDPVVVSGGRAAKHWPAWRGRGVDVWAADEAERMGIILVEYEPDGSIGSPACFHARNRQIVEHVAEAIRFRHGGWIAAFGKEPLTPGTAATVRMARRRGVPVLIEPIPGERPERVAATGQQGMF